MKIAKLLLATALVALAGTPAMAQKRTTTKRTTTAQTTNWEKIVDDGTTTIYYDTNIKTDSQGRHTVWVKTIYHTADWQRYFAQQIGTSTPVYMTKTKAMYDDIYSSALVRQVICYSKAGKKLADTGDDMSAGWSPVNASDPVGIVGEYLMDDGYGN